MTSFFFIVTRKNSAGRCCFSSHMFLSHMLWAAVFPKVDAPSARGLMGPPGLRPWPQGFGPGSASPSGLVQRVVIKPTPWRQSERLRRHFIAAKGGGDTITLGPKGPVKLKTPTAQRGRSNLRPKACQPLDPPVHQNAGISPSLKLSLMYFFTASLWKIFTNF